MAWILVVLTGTALMAQRAFRKYARDHMAEAAFAFLYIAFLFTYNSVHWATYREIHDLVLSRSSSGKLARLLLSWVGHDAEKGPEVRSHAPVTHEEMAHRIGAHPAKPSLVC